MKVFSKRTISKLSRQYAVTALHLPDGETLILHANEGTALGDIANTLASEKQMDANGVIVYTDESGRKLIEADGYIIPQPVKEAMQTFRIRRPTEHELRTCVNVLKEIIMVSMFVRLSINIIQPL